ncbi:hypothetical protein Patl1_24238 [Pistacia atlantica]|uniref:Uncharacterized protein n=1 Tax=Pistacia atlantica TaxID=434234 RepID=A0ACC1A0Y8_9ROSI|nr:hypothetical protein Patl1_24238 [Pistacia atlantica]
MDSSILEEMVWLTFFWSRYVMSEFKESPLSKKLDEDLSVCLHVKGISFPEEKYFYLCVQTTQTQMDIDVLHATYYMGALFFGLMILLVDGIPELSLTTARVPVLFKQKELPYYVIGQELNTNAAPGSSCAMISQENLAKIQGSQDSNGGRTFQDVKYYVDISREKKKLHLLSDVTGALRPGVLTALMGVSGAGKSTLLDVLAGRKTTSHIEGGNKNCCMSKGSRNIYKSFMLL